MWAWGVWPGSWPLRFCPSVPADGPIQWPMLPQTCVGLRWPKLTRTYPGHLAFHVRFLFTAQCAYLVLFSFTCSCQKLEGKLQRRQPRLSGKKNEVSCLFTFFILIRFCLALFLLVTITMDRCPGQFCSNKIMKIFKTDFFLKTLLIGILRSKRNAIHKKS